MRARKSGVIVTGPADEGAAVKVVVVKTREEVDWVWRGLNASS
jgi:hypothetical protein